MPPIGPRLSLRTTLLLTTIAGMAIVIVQLWREIRPLRHEVEALRADVGVLGIDDDRKIYAIQVKEPGSLHWKWRIWLPAGHDYWFYAARKVPSKGITMHSFRGFLGTGGQEFTLRVGVAPSENGTRWVYVKCPMQDCPFLEVEDSKWANGETMIDMDVAGTTSQVSSNVDEPLVLLRLAEDPRTSVKQPPDGLMIWISNKKNR